MVQLIIDEAGMCTEPQTMLPIISTQPRQIVLLGDHKQLRPIVTCSNARKKQLDVSLFERYAKSDYMLMLNLQYRMVRQRN